MIGIDMLLMGMQSSIIYSIINAEYLKKVEGILLLDIETPINTKYIYICSAEDAINIIDRNEKYSDILTLFVAGNMPDEYMKLPGKNINLIVSSLSLSNLHNHLYKTLARRKNWEIEINKITPKRSNIAKLLQVAVIISKGSFYLFDTSLTLVDKYTSENQMSELTEQLCSRRYLSRAALLKNFNYIIPDDGWYRGAGNEEYKMHPVKKDGAILGYLLTATCSPSDDFNEFIKLLITHLVKFLSTSKENSFSENRDFTKFLDNLFLLSDMDSSGNNSDMTNQLLQQLPFQPLRYIRFIVTSFNELSKNISNIISEMAQVFPNNNITSYDDGIVVMLSCPDIATHPEFDHDRLDQILLKYDGYAVISNPARIQDGFRTEYIQSKEMLHMLPIVKLDFEKRFIYLKRYINYCLIHLSATYLSEHYGHDKMIYFCHPEVVELMRYDKNNNSDFSDFLFTYILNDCSMAQTAKELNIHRNTVLYKLNKVKELVNIDLSDNMEKASILSSSQILRYVTKVQKHGLDT